MGNLLKRVENSPLTTGSGLAYLLLGAAILGFASVAVLPGFWWVRAGALVLFELAAVVFWLVLRRLPRFDARTLGLLVAVQPGGTLADAVETQLVIEQLVVKLQEVASEINDRRDRLRVAIRRLPRHIRVDSDERASELLRKAGAVFVIWANPTSGSLNGKAGVHFDVIHFALGHRELETDVHNELKSAMNLVTANPRRYSIHFDNDAIDIMTAARNLSLIAYYQVGLGLSVSGLTDLARTLIAKALTFEAPGNAYQKKAKEVLAVLHYLPWSYDGAWPMPGCDPLLLRDAMQDAVKSTELDPDFFNGWSLRANCNVLMGDLMEAEHCLRQVERCLPRTQTGLLHLNRACIALQSGNFSAALTHYRRCKVNSMSVEYVDSAVAWLTAGRISCPANALGLAYINDHFLDPITCVEDYQAALALDSLPPDVESFVRKRLAYRQSSANDRLPQSRGSRMTFGS